MSESVKMRAMCDSYGFRGYFWEEGAETNVYPEEMEDPAMAHFKPVSEILPDASPRQTPKRDRPKPVKKQAAQGLAQDDEDDDFEEVEPPKVRKPRKPRKPRAPRKPKAAPPASENEGEKDNA